jgi:serine/threonine protein kinase
VLDELGLGGMATVHRAERHGIEGFRKQVALKRLLPQYAGDPAARRAFLEEAKLSSLLHHANIAQPFDCGIIDDTYFIAMELVPGPTLKQLMIQCANAAGPIPVPIAIEILCQLCEALEHAHTMTDENGTPLRMIHRDVSPSNVIVSASGVVKLIDFGIAKAATSSQRTRAGVVKGKYGYLAPEYIDGKKIDLRVDLFGLGVVAYEILAGRRLFPGSGYDTLKAIRDRPIPRPSRDNPHVTSDLDDIVLTALQRDPSARWQSARAMHVALCNASRQFGAGVSHRQIRDWTEWAFSCNPRPNSDISRIVHAIESDPTGRSRSWVSPPPTTTTNVKTRRSPLLRAGRRDAHPTTSLKPPVPKGKTRLGLPPPPRQTSPRVDLAPELARPDPRPSLLLWFVAALMLGIAGIGIWRALSGL